MELKRAIVSAGRWPRLMSVILLCSLTLTACLDESCNFVGPSETAGSSGGDGTRVMVTIIYDTERVGINPTPGTILPFWQELPMITVNTRMGFFEVKADGRTSIVFEDVKQGEELFFGFLVNGAARTCTWTGKTKLFTADAFVYIQPHVVRDRYESECIAGWFD